MVNNEKKRCFEKLRTCSKAADSDHAREYLDLKAISENSERREILNFRTKNVRKSSNADISNKEFV